MLAALFKPNVITIPSPRKERLISFCRDAKKIYSELTEYKFPETIPKLEYQAPGSGRDDQDIEIEGFRDVKQDPEIYNLAKIKGNTEELQKIIVAKYFKKKLYPIPQPKPWLGQEKLVNLLIRLEDLAVAAQKLQSGILDRDKDITDYLLELLPLRIYYEPYGKYADKRLPISVDTRPDFFVFLPDGAIFGWSGTLRYDVQEFNCAPSEGFFKNINKLILNAGPGLKFLDNLIQRLSSPKDTSGDKKFDSTLNAMLDLKIKLVEKRGQRDDAMYKLLIGSHKEGPEEMQIYKFKVSSLSCDIATLENKLALVRQLGHDELRKIRREINDHVIKAREYWNKIYILPRGDRGLIAMKEGLRKQIEALEKEFKPSAEGSAAVVEHQQPLSTALSSSISEVFIETTTSTTEQAAPQSGAAATSASLATETLPSSV